MGADSLVIFSAILFLAKCSGKASIIYLWGLPVNSRVARALTRAPRL